MGPQVDAQDHDLVQLLDCIATCRKGGPNYVVQMVGSQGGRQFRIGYG